MSIITAQFCQQVHAPTGLGGGAGAGPPPPAPLDSQRLRPHRPAAPPQYLRRTGSYACSWLATCSTYFVYTIT